MLASGINGSHGDRASRSRPSHRPDRRFGTAVVLERSHGREERGPRCVARRFSPERYHRGAKGRDAAGKRRHGGEGHAFRDGFREFADLALATRRCDPRFKDCAHACGCFLFRTGQGQASERWFGAGRPSGPLRDSGCACNVRHARGARAAASGSNPRFAAAGSRDGYYRNRCRRCRCAKRWIHSTDWRPGFEGCAARSCERR